MWSATTETSDNKKREVDDDCQCSGSSGGSNNSSTTTASTTQAAASVVDTGLTAPAAAAAISIKQQQQQLNTFESNSKKETSTFGANFIASDAKKLSADLTETGDSGFISGPQTSTNIYHDDDDDDHEIEDEQSVELPKNVQQSTSQQLGEDNKSSTPTANPKQFNIVDHPQPKEPKLVLDSGCIDEDYDAADGDDEYDDDHDHDHLHEALQQQQQPQQQQSATSTEQQRSDEAQKFASSPARSNSTADQMILKNNVDAGMSQWFCQLSLQTDARNSQSQQQQQVAGVGMNNLDSRRSTGNAFSNRQQQQQQAAGNSATPTTTTTNTTNLTPSNAWEQFYQQNDDGDTPLHLACISGYADVVAALIRMAPHPCLFNIQNDEAQTPLHLAALTAQPKILRMLLIAGAEPTVRDRHGNTALHLACISGEEQCVRALTIPISASEINEAHRQYGHRSNDETVSYLKCASLPSDLEIRNYDGERCVHLAAQSGHIDILRILVLYGADINAREGKSGRTPLHIAIECCNEDLANFLLDECQKLNLETATYAGLTAYQVACILNKSQMQNMLEKRGAETLPTPDSDYDSSDIETDLDDSKIYNRFGDPGYFVGYNGGNPMTVA